VEGTSLMHCYSPRSGITSRAAALQLAALRAARASRSRREKKVGWGRKRTRDACVKRVGLGAGRIRLDGFVLGWMVG
jgi:hypothetical protein